MLGLFVLLTLYPFWFIIQGSVNDPLDQVSLLWPKSFYYANYYQIFHFSMIGNAYLVTLARIAVAVPLMIMVTGTAAFALTRKELKGRKPIILYYFITMFVGGGLIPFFMVLKTLHLVDTFWVFIFPVVFSVWTMIVMKTSFQRLPDGLVEAGLIDGASYFTIFARIVLPLSKPMIATLALFNAVWHWNDWFYGSFYINDERLIPLQTFLRLAISMVGGKALALGGSGVGHSFHESAYPEDVAEMMRRLTPESMRYAFAVVGTVPILVVYPFIQRYFIKGVLIGSVKE